MTPDLRRFLPNSQAAVSAACFFSAGDEIVRELVSRASGSMALVVGHSNTVPAIIAGLGVLEPVPAIEEAQSQTTISW